MKYYGFRQMTNMTKDEWKYYLEVLRYQEKYIVFISK